jgi:hypothetical protein
VTWKPRYLVRKAPGVDGPPIPADEPVLVIRAQDELALEMVTHYIGRHIFKYHSYAPLDPIVVELDAHRQAILEWQAANPDRVKRADR